MGKGGVDTKDLIIKSMVDTYVNASYECPLIHGDGEVLPKFYFAINLWTKELYIIIITLCLESINYPFITISSYKGRYLICLIGLYNITKQKVEEK